MLIAFIFFIIGILSAIYSPFLLLISSIPFLYLFLYKKNKRSYIFFIFTICGFLLIFLLPKGDTGINELYGICVYKKNTYYLILTIKGKFYVQDKNDEVTLFSILHLYGNSSKLSITHYESIFNFKDYLKTQGCFYKFEVSKKEFILKNPLSNTPIKNYIFSFLNEESKIFIASLLFGDSLYELSSVNALKNLSLISWFSLSGFHISFLFNSIENFLTEKGKKRFVYFELIAILFFLFVSNFKFSITRIFLLKFLYLLNEKTSFKLEYIDRLSLTAFITIFINPYSILSASFYYSFPLLFTLAIFKEKRYVDFKNNLLSKLKIYLFFIPYTFISNPYFNIISPLLQLIFLPISHVLFLLSCMLIIIPQIGFILNPIITFLLNLFTSIDNIPFSINIGNMSVVLVIIYYLIYISILILHTYGFKKEKQLGYVLLGSVLLIQMIPDFLYHYEVTFIDVGQGDSTLIQYKNKNILIDTGGNKKIDIANDCLIPFLAKKKIRKLDAVIITHEDYDHYGALENLMSSFTVDNVYYYYDFKDKSIFFSDLEIKNLNSFYTSTSDENEKSGVYNFKINNIKFLIMGDATKEIEADILNSKQDIDIDVIKIGHHGSNTSSSTAFLKACSPKLAIISCGENNSYNHPSDETIETLSSLSIPYKRTDIEGSISISCLFNNL